VDRAAEVQLDLAGGQLVGYVTGARQRAGEAVELGDHGHVAGAAGGQRLAQPWSRAGGVGEAVVDVDAIGSTPSASSALPWAASSWPWVDTRA